MGSSRSQGFFRRTKVGNANTVRNRRDMRTWAGWATFGVIALAVCGFLFSGSFGQHVNSTFSQVGAGVENAYDTSSPAMAAATPAAAAQDLRLAANGSAAYSDSGPALPQQAPAQAGGGASTEHSTTGSTQNQTQPQPWE